MPVSYTHLAFEAVGAIVDATELDVQALLLILTQLVSQVHRGPAYAAEFGDNDLLQFPSGGRTAGGGAVLVGGVAAAGEQS